MLVASANIWDTRVQSVGALVTAAGGDRREAYYLATACQVGIEPPLISISPNPEYPICAAISASRRFGIHYLGESQQDLVRACTALDRELPDKIAALGLRAQDSAHGTPMLEECLRAIECEVVRAWDSGDHRTIIGRVLASRHGTLAGAPQRYFPLPGPGRRLFKEVFVRSRLYDLMLLARRAVAAAPDVREGTQRDVRTGAS
ncbi:MAG: flavin reductase family protein [Gemmatimonadetes bacterium]|nr:flavin reductase family protein [Gemmatimonadota bacterium]